jgi:purine catabolism regulator
VSLTLAEIIEMPVMQRGAPEVRSACRWQDTIRWVHGSDLADLSTLLQGGELVLTTGAALARAPRKYLRGLAQAGAVGVVVEVGSVVSDLPAGVGRIAEEFDLALVVLHRKIRFVEVTEAVHRRIVAEQYAEVAFDREVHETFTELSMKRASMSGIVDAAARILDEPMVLEDLAHQAVAVSSGTPAELLDDWERRSRRTPGRTGDPEPWAITGVGPRSQQWGRLVVPHQPANPGRAKMVLERAAAALAMHRMVEQDRTGLQHQAQR